MTRVPTYSAAQVRAAEAPLLAAGVPLMRRAAHALAELVVERAPDGLLVLAGAGDNGGDALFAAAELAAGGTRVDIVRVHERVHEQAFAAAVDAGASVIPTADPTLGSHGLVVDGILGIGARGGLRGAAREVVERLLPSRPAVVAVDLPSGLDPDTGDADDVVLPAATTVTFGAVKHGLTVGSGPRLAGGILLVDLGLELENPVGRATIAGVRQG
ncbi:MAG: NAD(P)H-hydrate epimerase [Microbacterium sp.]|uniref:NAD(P)H-hydrate epimerase n=1 Tax=Microbacterium sp. TaxID=51671 RepID=UPI0039E22B28